MPQPAEVDALGEQIRTAYRQAWDAIVAEQRALADDPRQWRRQRRLAEVRAKVESLMGDVDRQARVWLSEQFPRAYGLGAVTGARAAGVGFDWTGVHVDAVTRLANDTFSDLLSATDGVRKSTKALIRRLAKEQVEQQLIVGRTAQQASGILADLLEGRGVWAVRYKDGSLHGLSEYTDMLVRTKSAVAYVEGTVRASGVEWFEGFDGQGCGVDGHEDTNQADGLIVDVQTALQFPISHPNCRRSWAPRPDITSADEAKQAKATPRNENPGAQAAADQQHAERDALRQRREQLARRQERLAARRP